MSFVEMRRILDIGTDLQWHSKYRILQIQPFLDPPLTLRNMYEDRQEGEGAVTPVYLINTLTYLKQCREAPIE